MSNVHCIPHDDDTIHALLHAMGNCDAEARLVIQIKNFEEPATDFLLGLGKYSKKVRVLLMNVYPELFEERGFVLINS
jgi:hypothetical protein